MVLGHRSECRPHEAREFAGDTVREATSDEVKELRAENRELKEVVAEVTLKIVCSKKV